MTAYRRYRLKGDCYFFTVALAERGGSLLTENIGGLRVAFRDVRRAHPFTTEAVVILPDHLHCIWTLPEGDDDFSTRWRQIKAAFSRGLPQTERRSENRLNRQERVSGKVVFGKTPYGTMRITSVTWITPTTTRSSMGMSRGWWTGGIRHSTGF